MPKTSLKPTSGLTSWADVDRGLMDLGDLAGKIKKCEAKYDQWLEKIKSDAAAIIQDLALEMDDTARDIYLFVVQRISELDQKRSKKLTHGMVAFRKSEKLVLPKKIADVIARLEELGQGACVETKKSIKKIAVRKLPEEIIAAVGGRIEHRDNFRIELPENIYEYDKKLKIVKS